MGIMEIPSLLQIQQKLNEKRVGDLPTLRGLILENITLQSLEPYFKYQLHAESYQLNLQYGGYDTIYQDSLDPNLFQEALDFILIGLWLPSFSKALYENFSQLSEVQAIEEVN